MRTHPFHIPFALLLAVLATSLALGQEEEVEPGPFDPAAKPMRYIEREQMVPVPNAYPGGLDVLELYIDTPGRHPLVVLTHGTSVKPEERMQVTPWAQYGQALWFARRGYVVLIVVRKGYGRSSGKQDSTFGGCGNRGSFEEAGEASAGDLTAVMKWAANLPEIDPTVVISAGVSTGGFAQAALVANPPKQLKAAISFAGGRGSDGKEHNCDLGGVTAAFQHFGKESAKHGATPMLWIYSENDHYFPPPMATRFEEAYRKGGGADQFVMAPPNGDDGHHLYSHPDAWTATVTEFLRAHALLPLGNTVLPPPAIPNVPPPPGLHERGIDAWRRFLAAPPYKTFATTGEGGWGLSGGKFNQDLADHEALERCRKAVVANAGSCRIAAQTPNVRGH